MRWPFMTKAAHEAELARVTDLMQGAVDREFRRAMAEGRRAVHAWAVEANYNVFNHANPRGAAAAAFQEADRQFRATPLTLGEVLNGAPATVEEAVNAVTGS